MDIIDLSVSKQVITRSADTALVAGEVGVHGVRVTYDAAWDGAASRVLCFSGPTGHVAVMDEGGETPIPWEVIREPGMLDIGIVGYDNAGTMVITTRVQAPYNSRFRVYPNTSCDNEAPPPAEYTPNVWDQLLGSIGALSALKTSAKNNLVAAINEVFDLIGTGGGGGGVDFTTDDTLVLENGVLRVNTTNDVAQDNTLPITSAAVHTTVGNIEILLGTI